ncbi:hypothetical protein [Streptomyces sp. NBC_00687]|uniref:hypothetical protein n=1 Tax=Streptomyces sp. NBC_00687 TaxID=2975807 RepID=UPI00224F5CEF|nr:hypothetical protein [Streptomyces sp. NBC_00687]MCX4912399.1 hypothetical protein [Streptomyces sp. NBC_00687]
MRSSTARTAITLCAAASLAAVMGTASAAPQAPGAVRAPQPKPSAPVLVDCLWKPDVRPTNFILACGDGNSRLVSLHWSHWNQSSAEARGVNVVNDCKPYCAAGRFHSYPVVVKLDHPQSWKKNPHQRHYTQMTLVYTHDRPAGFDRTVSYPLWN